MVATWKATLLSWHYENGWFIFMGVQNAVAKRLTSMAVNKPYMYYICHTLLDVLCNCNVAYVHHDNTLVVARTTHSNF